MSDRQGVGAAAPAHSRHYTHLDWKKIAPVDSTVPALLAWGAATHGDTELLVIDGERLTYADAHARSETFAALLLARGIGKGARIGLLLPDGVDFLTSWFATTRIGAVAVPISTLSAPVELVRIIRSSGISLLIATDRFHNVDFLARLEEALDLAGHGPVIACPATPSLRAVWLWSGATGWAERIDALAIHPLSAAIVAAAEAAVLPADQVTIVYTSGSTSEPKGVIHSHGTFTRSAQRWCASMPFHAGDRFFGNSPMFWVGGLITSLLAIMQVGATLVSSTSPNPRFILDMIESERCTLVLVWPFLARRLSEDPSFAGRDWSAIRAGSVLAMIPPERRPANRNTFGLAMGMTETAGPHSTAMAVIDDDHEGAMGLLAPGMEHRIVDPETGAPVPDGAPGELYLRGDTLMLGYVGHEPSSTFDPDGWFATGDICAICDDHLYFHGRRDTMIKTSGANVAPAEVEAALVQVEGVAEAHVLGLADAERGQIVSALIVLHADADRDPVRIILAVRRLLSPYKVPRRLLLVDSIPTTATNKLDRRAATRLLEEKAAEV